MNIDDDCVFTFLRLLNNEEVDLKEEEFFNLMKLTDIFKIDSLNEILKNYLRNNTKSIDFILSLKIAQEQNENVYFTDEISVDIESYLKDNINECLASDKIGILSVSSVYRMIEKSDPEKISSELLYRYIINNIEERHLLFQFINIEKLTEESFENIYYQYKNNKKIPFFACIPSIEYIKQLRDKIKLLEQQNENLSKINDQLEKQKNEEEKQNSELKIQVKMQSDEINSMKNYFRTNNNINIFVKNLRGNVITIALSDEYTIEKLKELVYLKEGTLPCEHRLIYNGKMLEDENTLRDYGIGSNSTIHLIPRLRGDKPVIYLYPEQDNFDVKVKIEMKKEDGEIAFKYPSTRDNEDNYWIIKANKNGNIIYKNRNIQYLFWECLFNKPFNINEGFVIEGKDCGDFFEEKFDYLGISNNITADFITYWCPKMIHSNYVLIKFQGDEYDQIAPLTIDPKPNHLVRVFVTFRLLEEKITIPIQNIDKFSIKDKKGFLVFEWGGCLEQF